VKLPDFKLLSVEDLLGIKREVDEALASKVASEKKYLEQRLRELQEYDTAPSGISSPQLGKKKRYYPPVTAKYRNPENPNEAWSGRGLQPKWVVEGLEKGKRISDFEISKKPSQLSSKKSVPRKRH
jgi:DNA-binding protein H-NS